MKYLLFLLLPFICGCLEVVHDNYPVERPILNKVRIDNNRVGYYKAIGATLVVPRDNPLDIEEKDLRLLTEEAVTKDEIYKKALILHEEAHAKNQRSLEGMIGSVFMRKQWLWWEEREGYGVFFIYLHSKGIRLDQNDYDQFAFMMMNAEIYEGMATEKEVKEFLDKFPIWERGE